MYGYSHHRKIHLLDGEHACFAAIVVGGVHAYCRFMDAHDLRMNVAGGPRSADIVEHTGLSAKEEWLFDLPTRPMLKRKILSAGAEHKQDA